MAAWPALSTPWFHTNVTIQPRHNTRFFLFQNFSLPSKSQHILTLTYDSVALTASNTVGHDCLINLVHTSMLLTWSQVGGLNGNGPYRLIYLNLNAWSLGSIATCQGLGGVALEWVWHRARKCITERGTLGLLSPCCLQRLISFSTSATTPATLSACVLPCFLPLTIID